MSTAPKASVAPWKRKLVEDLEEKFEEYPAVGILDILGIPAPQFQEMRELLRGKAEIKVSRKELLRISIEKASEDKGELQELKDYLEGQSALIFTEMDPFKLWKLLRDNRTSAPAKVGMESPQDIIIPKGETHFPPGPIVGELQRAGVSARIQAGKVVVVEDSKIVEEGEGISEEVAGVLSRFGIEPREIGFELKGAYWEGTVFPGDSLRVDEEETLSNIQRAYADSLKLSFEIQFPTVQSLRLMIAEASSRAHNLAFNALIFTSMTAPQVLSRASSEMLGLASTLASKDPESIDEELRSKLPTRPTTEETEGEEKPKEEVEEDIGEEEPKAGLGGLFE